MSAIVSIAGSLPKELPLLLIGAGLGNLSLAQTLRKSGLATPSHIRIFDQFRATSRPSYSLTLHPWGYEDIQEVVGDKKPIAFCAVDASLGGKGRVERRVFDIETGATVGRIDGYGDKSIRVNRGVLGQMLKDGLSIDFEKKFERFEAVRDEDGREAIRAWFVDGESVLGSGIIAGDGVHSKGTPSY
jgi:2-polyprenyl-6-methoxyphenol hydroxylase-like FAD-dependent oxidoreductase